MSADYENDVKERKLLSIKTERIFVIKGVVKGKIPLEEKNRKEPALRSEKGKVVWAEVMYVESHV